MKIVKNEVFQISIIILLIIAIGIIDLSNLDNRLSTIIFGITWDMSYYNVIGSILIPFTIFYLGIKINAKYLKFGNLDKYKLDSIKEIYGELGELSDRANNLFSILKTVPKDDVQRREYYIRLFKDFAEANNNFIKVFNQEKLFLNNLELETEIDEYTQELRLAYYSYENAMRYQEDVDLWKEYYNQFKEIRDRIDGKKFLSRIESQMRKYISE